jgi:ArsR family transcriptional regulator, arsenate/arsenite/antimonite-responsive transcriptional repressor
VQYLRKTSSPALSARQIERIASALAAPRRSQILRDIGEADDAYPCTALIETHKISAATVSHHLKELEAADLVEVIRDGKYLQLRLRRDVLGAYIKHLSEF